MEKVICFGQWEIDEESLKHERAIKARDKMLEGRDCCGVARGVPLFSSENYLFVTLASECQVLRRRLAFRIVYF